jgi:hypothetical protein
MVRGKEAFFARRPLADYLGSFVGIMRVVVRGGPMGRGEQLQPIGGFKPVNQIRHAFEPLECGRHVPQPLFGLLCPRQKSYRAASGSIPIADEVVPLEGLRNVTSFVRVRTIRPAVEA